MKNEMMQHTIATKRRGELTPENKRLWKREGIKTFRKRFKRGYLVKFLFEPFYQMGKLDYYVVAIKCYVNETDRLVEYNNY